MGRHGRARRHGLSPRIAAPWKLTTARKPASVKRSRRVVVVGRRTIRTLIGKRR